VIGIIIPLIQEASVFKIKKRDTKRPVEISENILIYVSGVGIKNASNAVDALAPKVSHLISWGTAAGLSRHLKPGDLLLPDLIIDKNEVEFKTDPGFKHKLVERIPNTLSYESGLLCESTNILKEVEEKEAFGKKYNAMGCDMESAVIAKLANQRGISFNALRVISDDYSTPIPKSVYLSIDKDGDFSIRKFLFQLLLTPKDIVQVVRLGKSFSKAKKTMSVITKILLEL